MPPEQPAEKSPARAKAEKTTIKTLRKIMASQGKLDAWYYLATDTKGEDAVLYSLPRARDPKGQKVLAEGKKLRKEVPGAKFARGLVTGKGAKLFFELSIGTASKGHLKTAFKDVFSQVPGMGFLQGAKVKLPGAAPQGDAPEDGRGAAAPARGDARRPTTGLELEAGASPPLRATDPGPPAAQARVELATSPLSTEELAEVEEELAAATDIARISSADFLSAESAREEREEQRREGLDQIEKLAKANPLDRDALQRARAALAESFSVGDDPFPDVGGNLSPENQQVLLSSINASFQRMRRELEAECQQILGGQSMPSNESEAAQRAQILRDNLSQLKAMIQ